ncbi:hypothetical protein BFP70_19010 [Thioclava sp. SK-1]|uniref:hypothetical protein n=1 Tax=Thioclava sp. SK-1 TaxID=1889770 RepID=UPI000824D0A8|nr:hypothetical protein [Thioclava sp. SK-1]OCX58151.1 hypothetical protein BFP70_19010 [Thioclava sp. SK-1]
MTMRSDSTAGTSRTIVIFAGALGGFAVALYNYLTPLTGVTGTFGAGLVIASTLLLAIAAVLIQISRPGAWRVVLRILVALGGVLTALAGYFLHEWWLIVAMAIVLLGLLFDIYQGRNSQTGAFA